MEIQIFENSEFGQIRTVRGEMGEPWFVGKDVAEVLGYSNTRKALMDHVEDEDKTDGVTIRDAIGRNQNPILINESGLYSLILASKLEKAKEFKHWVTAVVLPQIRRTGGYIPFNQEEEEDENSLMARALLIAQKTIEMKNSLLEEQKPLVKFAEAVTGCDDAILVRQLAKLITQNGYEIGERRLFVWLKANGYLFKKDGDHSPRQKWVEKGLFTTSVSIIQTHHGAIERITTKVTGKGQKYFVNGFLTGAFKAGNEDLAEMM